MFKMAGSNENQPRQTPEPVWGLVLSGGRSRRMGRDKALLEQDGLTALDRAVELLARRVERVLVSVRPDQTTDSVRARFDQIVDRYDGIGPAAGILSALEAYPDVAWLVMACDLPNVDDATIASLLSSRSQQPFTAFRSSHDGLPEPLCAIYRPAARPLVADFVREGVICPRKMLIRSDTELLELPFPDSLENLNTPEDFERLRSSGP
ncbi:MAG TPA: NTP transferase domain-containing protein [Woeseiaceae bacterium]